MAKFIMVACDLHDKTMLLKVSTGRGAAETVSVRNTPAGRQRLIAELQARAKAAGGAKIILAYEASGQGFGWYDELIAAGIECHVLAPTKMARSVQQERNKTDEKDAEQILQLLRGHVLAGNPLPTVWVPDPQTRDDREGVRCRLDAAEKLTAVKTQVQSLLKRSHQARPAGLGQGWTRRFWAWLRGLCRDEAQGLGLRETLTSLLRQLEFLEQEVRRLDQALLRLAAVPRYEATVNRVVQQLTGVGVLTALVFLTEVGDLRRFANRRQISAYLGLAPRSYESGSASDRKGHITRQGPSRVRRVCARPLGRESAARGRIKRPISASGAKPETQKDRHGSRHAAIGGANLAPGARAPPQRYGPLPGRLRSSAGGACMRRPGSWRKARNRWLLGR